jgi:hypothetical protein
MTIRVIRNKDRIDKLDEKLYINSLFYHQGSDLLFGGGLDKIVIWDIDQFKRCHILNVDCKTIYSINATQDFVVFGGENGKIQIYNIFSKETKEVAVAKAKIKAIEIVSKDILMLFCMNNCILTYNVITRETKIYDTVKANCFVKY